MSRTVVVPCLVQIERTARSLHAHAIPDGVAIGPGDTVLVHGAPTAIAFGERIERACTATVRRAGPLRRFWTRTSSILHLASLYEVGFEPHSARSGPA